MLKRAKDNNHLSHAYLFYGPKGTGKKEMAYMLSLMLYCKNDVCFTCDDCKNILNGNNLNVIYIGKDEKKTVISKEQIESLQEEFSKTSLLNGPRIYIVDGIDLASQAAQNSLLKFIEEPENAEESIGIFIADELSNVLSTIQSRCELVYFKEISKDILIRNLKDEGIDDLNSSMLASITNNIDEAMSIYGTEKYENAKNMFLELINCKTKYDGVNFSAKYSNYNTTTGAKDLSNDIAIITLVCNFIITFLDDLLFHLKDNDSLILYPLYDKIKAYKQTKKNVEYRLSRILNSFDKLRYNVAPKNVFFEVMIYFLE